MKNLSTIISWLKLNLKHVGYGQANHLPSRVKYKYFSIKLGPALGLLLPALVPLLPALEHVTFKKKPGETSVFNQVPTRSLWIPTPGKHGPVQPR